MEDTTEIRLRDLVANLPKTTYDSWEEAKKDLYQVYEKMVKDNSINPKKVVITNTERTLGERWADYWHDVRKNLRNFMRNRLAC